jgi:hypothetical protein
VGKVLTGKVLIFFILLNQLLPLAPIPVYFFFIMYLLQYYLQTVIVPATYHHFANMSDHLFLVQWHLIGRDKTLMLVSPGREMELFIYCVGMNNPTNMVSRSDFGLKLLPRKNKNNE